MFGVNRNLHVKKQNISQQRKRQREAVYADPPSQVAVMGCTSRHNAPSFNDLSSSINMEYQNSLATHPGILPVKKRQVLNERNMSNERSWNNQWPRNNITNNGTSNISNDLAVKENIYTNRQTTPFAQTKNSLYQEQSTTAGKTEKTAIVSKKRNEAVVPKMITSSIQGLSVWNEYLSSQPVIYEICGSLESTMSNHQVRTDKNFAIKDGSGKISCVFWEIDRKLQHFPRGTILRCVGRLLDEKFHCISLRKVKIGETQLLQYLVNQCESKFQEIVHQNES